MIQSCDFRNLGENVFSLIESIVFRDFFHEQFRIDYKEARENVPLLISVPPPPPPSRVPPQPIN